MPAFNVGDKVVLGVPNGSGAFKSLNSKTTYSVEAVSAKCSRCGPGSTGTVKILGAYYCAESFMPASAGAQVASVKRESGSTRDPARDLYASDVDWFDTLPDATAEEMRTLPTLQQLREREQKAREGK